MVLELEEEVVVVEAEVERCGGMSRNELFFCFFLPLCSRLRTSTGI